MTESGRLICREKCGLKLISISSCEIPYRVSLRPSHGSPHVVAGRLSAVAAMEFSQHNEGDEDEDEQDDRHCDPHLDRQFLSHSIHATGFHSLHQVYSWLVIAQLQRDCHKTICPPHSRPFFSIVYAQPFVTMMHCEANYIAESTQFCP